MVILSKVASRTKKRKYGIYWKTVKINWIKTNKIQIFSYVFINYIILYIFIIFMEFIIKLIIIIMSNTDGEIFVLILIYKICFFKNSFIILLRLKM
ncbi:hypothetical protein H8356DRAFT_1662632 [Neocallimastix lanati (nom. inval.)]|nr:hypothetical protein H8356DRAFT_1662632 [Neocallimastix sp. JGI-2020a]